MYGKVGTDIGWLAGWLAEKSGNDLGDCEMAIDNSSHGVDSRSEDERRVSPVLGSEKLRSEWENPHVTSSATTLSR